MGADESEYTDERGGRTSWRALKRVQRRKRKWNDIEIRMYVEVTINGEMVGISAKLGAKLL